MKNIHKFLTAPLVIALFATALSSCSDSGATAGSSTTTTKPVTLGDLIVGLTADGSAALPVTNLNFEVEGIISEIYVSAGESVKKGTLLAELDSSDYQLSIETAENNLKKAQTNYDDAVWQYEQGLKSDEISLTSTRKTLDAGFDDYSYLTAISDAELTLQKRKSELADAQASMKSPYDSYSSDRQLEDAKTLLATRLTELNEAKATLASPQSDNTYADAETTLATRKKELSQAQSKAASAYDYTNINRQIADAIKNVDDKLVALANEQTENFESAWKAYSTALTALERLYEDRDIASSQAQSDATDKLATAKQNVTSAEKTLEKAKKNLNTAVETAQKNYDTALLSLNRLEQDIDRSMTTSEKDASTKLATATQNLSDAERALEKAQQNYERAKSDYQSSFAKNEGNYTIQADNLERAKQGSTAVSNAASAVKDAELALKNANNKLEKIRIYAPISGQVINISKKVGEKVTANTSGGLMQFGTSASGSSFMTICELSEIYLSANITEGDIIGVEKGQTVKVQVDAISDRTFTGTVQTVSSLPTTDSNGITTYAVTVKLDNADPTIRDGMAAQLTFIRLEHTNVLMIPNKAVFIENGKQYVNVPVPGGYEKREVSCGLTNGSETEVLSGLAEGESVVVGAIK